VFKQDLLELRFGVRKCWGPRTRRHCNRTIGEKKPKVNREARKKKGRSPLLESTGATSNGTGKPKGKRGVRKEKEGVCGGDVGLKKKGTYSIQGGEEKRVLGVGGLGMSFFKNWKSRRGKSHFGRFGRGRWGGRI